MKMKKFLAMLKGDKIIWMAVFVLAVLGSIEVYSCTSNLAFQYQGGNMLYYPMKHLFFVLLGFVMMFVFSWVPYKHHVKYTDILFWVFVALLGITLLLGPSTNDARRWFKIPLLDISFQPSDFAKLALVLYLAKMLALAQVEAENRRKYFMRSLAAIGIVCALVFPANFSTAMLIGLASLGMLFLGNFPTKWILGVVGAGLVAMLLFVAVVKVTGTHSRLNTWVSRVETFFSDDSSKKTGSDFQARQSLVAISQGGFIGKGVGNGPQINVIPHPYSDFIFASIAHEMGIVFVIIVILAYIVMFYRCVVIVRDVGTLFPALLVMGLLMNIMLQTLSNMFVAIGLMPVTGQPLPFVSMGGTSLISTGIALGVILNVSRYSGKKETLEEIEQDESEQEEIVDYPFMAG